LPTRSPFHPPWPAPTGLAWSSPNHVRRLISCPCNALVTLVQNPTQ
jgi:hypothetical protein